MRSRSLLWAFASALALAACGGPSATTEPDRSGAPTGVAKRSADPAAPAEGKAAQTDAAGSALPDSLRHDGFSYSGLGSDQPVKYQLVRSAGAAPETGEQVASLKEVKDGKAVYTVKRTGGLSVLGDDELLVDAQGVYTTKSSLGEMDSKNLELPAKLEPGHTWKERHTLAQPGGEKVTIESTYKVVGNESVKTKLGTFDALVVSATGPVQVGSQKMELSAKTWYVKDRGPVKLVVVQNVGGKSTTMTMEAVP